MGGGYVFKMKNITTNQAILAQNINKIKEMNWIDRQTRAVFLEFTLFNPNFNLFSHSLILFEFLSTGNIISTVQFSPINLFDINENNFLSFKLIINIIYMAFVSIYLIKEIIYIYKYGKAYFTQLYNYTELLIIGFSWASFVMYLYRLYSANEIFNLINKYKSSNQPIQNIYINLQYISYCNDLLRIFLGFCAAFGTIRFIKLFRYNKFIIVFVQAFSKSLLDLISFFLIFIILWLTFVQTIYLLFQDKSDQFATLVSTMESCFQIILGNFDVRPLINSNAFFGTLFFTVYNIVVVFMLINIFFTILIEHYRQAKKTNDLFLEDPELLDYIKHKFSYVLSKMKKKNQNKESSRVNYSNHLETLSKQINQLIIKIENVGYLIS